MQVRYSCPIPKFNFFSHVNVSFLHTHESNLHVYWPLFLHVENYLTYIFATSDVPPKHAWWQLYWHSVAATCPAHTNSWPLCQVRPTLASATLHCPLVTVITTDHQPQLLCKFLPQVVPQHSPVPPLPHDPSSTKPTYHCQQKFT